MERNENGKKQDNNANAVKGTAQDRNSNQKAGHQKTGNDAHKDGTPNEFENGNKRNAAKK